MPDDLMKHCDMVFKAMLRGDVVPFLGAGVNKCTRPKDAAWEAGQTQYLPDGGELAKYLAGSFPCPRRALPDLARVSQLYSIALGDAPLYRDLNGVFNADYAATPVHDFLARLPQAFRDKGYAPRCQLIVTTNYDDVLERAFQNEPFDLIVYMATGSHKGKFLHQPPGAAPRPIDEPNTYELPLDADRRGFVRPVILKMHGAVARQPDYPDSYVITEDDYIDYLTRTDLDSLLPKNIVQKLRFSNLLFLGYGLRDWNVRVILHRMATTRVGKITSWAIQYRPDEMDEKFWQPHNVQILDARLEDYIAGLIAIAEKLEVKKAAGGKP